MAKRCTSSSLFVNSFEETPHKSNKFQKKLFHYKHSNKFFPSPYPSISHLFSSEDGDEQCEVPKYQLLQNEVPKYPHGLNTHRLSEGSRNHLKSLLSNKKQKRDFLVTKNNTKVDVSSLKGKYVLICSFFVPVRRDHPIAVKIIVAMGHLYTELCKRGDFEMVMVAKMRRDWDSEIVFDHFFSGFHDNCLAIPYSDYESRDFVAKSLGLGNTVENVATLFLSPSGEVLNKELHWLLTEYGAASFPFTDVHFANLQEQDVILKCRLDAVCNEQCSLYHDPWSPISLQELIQCETLSNISDEGVRISVSDLSKKIVGLYLCESGGYIDFFARLQRQCIEQGLEFEIVLVCLPFYNDPQTYMKYVKIVVEEYGISSWWALPYNDILCRTLWRICQSCGDDQMIMLPPPDGVLKSGDFNGKAIANVFGIEAYPFTKEAIIAKKESILKSYTIESLLQEFEYVIQYRGRLKTRLPLSDLRDKNVILYIDYHLDYEKHLYKSLRECYSQIQSYHPGTQLIFVPIDDKYEKSYSYDEIPPWLMMLPSTVSSVSVINKVFLLEHREETQYPTLIAFGKNGRMLSRNGIPRDISSLFSDTLRSELRFALHYSLISEA